MNAGPLNSAAPPVPLAEQAYRMVVERLASGPPGQRLVEQELADALAMSRTPVREALRRLAAEGVIRRTSGRSYVRREVNLRDVSDHYDLRLLFEPEAAALCALRVPPCDAEAIREMEESAGCADFHRVVGTACGNGALGLVIDILSASPLGRPVGGDALALTEARRSEHLRIVDAVRSRNAGAAATVMHEHLEDLRAEALGTLATPGRGRGRIVGGCGGREEGI